MSLSKNSQYYFNLINKQQRCLGMVLPSGGVVNPVSENRCWAFYFPAVFTLGIWVCECWYITGDQNRGGCNVECMHVIFTGPLCK